MGNLLRFLPAIVRLWPIVLEAVRTVEAIRQTESGDVKKALAKKFIQEKVPNLLERFGMSEKDWDNLVGGLIDVAVAFLNWLGKW